MGEAFVYVIMTPVRVAQDIHINAHSLGIWMSSTVGSVIGITCLVLAKCMEAFVYVMMTPVRVAQDIHVKVIKVIVRLLENTPGGVSMLKVFNGYVNTHAASVAHDCEN